MKPVIYVMLMLGLAGCEQETPTAPSVPPKEGSYIPRDQDRANYDYVHSHDCHWGWRNGPVVNKDSYGQESIVPAMNYYDCRDGSSYIIFEKVGKP